MWTSFKAADSVLVGGIARAIIGVAAALCAVGAAAPSQAAVEYVKVCSIYQVAELSYIPGTDTCLDNNQIVKDQFGIVRALSRAATGAAMSAALVNPYLPDGTNYAISAHWAGFDGQHALGFAGLLRISGNLVLSVGFSAGLDRGSLTSSAQRSDTDPSLNFPSQSWTDVQVMGRVGLTYGW
jgi:hypothetical protein